MSEAEYLCDLVAVINKGKIIAADTPSGIRQKFGKARTVELVADVLTVHKVRDLVAKIVNPGEIVLEGHMLRIRAERPADLLMEILAESERNGYRFESISIREPSLEDVLVQMVT